jgi:PAS domain S-box-containing protein
MEKRRVSHRRRPDRAAAAGVLVTTARTSPSSTEWLVGGGDMAKAIKRMNWSETPLGPMASWPQSLRTTVSLVQASSSPISLVWGPGHVQIYNDGYWPICGAKHPVAMGQDFRECWASAFPVIGEAYAKAWAGQSAYLEKMRMFLNRDGFLEETWFTFSFSPITDESGGVGGLFHPVTEMTTQMLSERRGRTLRDLGIRASTAKTTEEAFVIAAQVLAESGLDVPFFLLYLIDAGGRYARLVGQNGLAPGTLVSPERVDLRAPGKELWRVAEVARTGRALQIEDTARHFAGASVGPYPEVPTTALTLPILQPGRERPVAVLVAGVSSRLAMNEAYRDFYNLIATTVGAARANAAAYESERRNAGPLQNAIFNSANFSSIATDAKGVIQIFNVGAERMLGYTAAEVMNQITPADISEPQEVIARAKALSVELDAAITPGFEALVFKASRGIEDIYELTYIRKDGSRFPAVVSVTALRDAQGAIIGYLLIGTDNTARKQAEEALLKAGALQSAIFNSANFSSIATDAKGVIQIFNVGAERMLGYTAAEVMNKITPADISDSQEVIARAKALSVELDTPITPGFEALVFKASRGIEDIYELTYIRKDGSRFPAVVSVTALRDAQDTIIGYLLIGTDNTARQQVEDERQRLDQRLRDQHFYTRSLIESNIDALMTTDPRGVVTDVNKQTEALTGCTRDELIGAPFKNYFTDPARAQAGIRRVLTEGRVTNYELTARARDGKETVVSYNAITFHDRDRRLQGVFAAARDVTELKRFEQALQQKNAELQDASRMKSEFLANMSHELRTPLNAIIGFSEALRDGLIGLMTEKQREYIGDIHGSGKHLLSLINDILDLSKVEAGKMTLDLEPVLVSALVVNSLSIIREKAATREIRLDLDVEEAEALGSIQVDPRKMKQILYNLLSNAVKFTPEGGQVTLRASRVPRGDVGQPSIDTAQSFPLADNAFMEFLKISISDTGIGISEGGLADLFRPFSQVDSGLSRQFEGTGLGLAMVKLLAELHGGTVAVESVVGEGSCFTVWLPLRDVEEAAVAGPAVLGNEVPQGARIALVVEDDYKSAELIRLQLEAEGFTVLHAASAEAALALAVQQPVSLITLDIMLPHMNGWELLSRIKQVPALSRIPVVIISIVADRTKGFALGAAAVMQKPMSRQELYESLLDLGLFPVPSDQTRTVLVVDDDPKAVDLIAIRLEGLANVLRAGGGRDAIEIARRELPDLIVLDLMMPDVNGFDVVEALKEQPDTAGIPILVVTAKLITAEDLAKLNGYVTTILEKSGFDSDRFIAEIRRAMSGRRVAA